MEKFLLIASMFFSVQSCAQGGGSSVGPSLCSFGLYTCTSSDHPTDHVLACVRLDVANVPKSLIISIPQPTGNAYGEEATITSRGTDVRIPTYVTADAKLEIYSDFVAADGRIYAHFNYPSRGLSQLPMRCTKNR